MSSRLKKRLGDLGIDTSSRKANENFCLIGTPLPPLEKSKDTGEFVPLWKQEVRDEKGRRRLHGAFTGGWSAGYFNTVGSKEGWAPANFVSSRNERAKKQAVRPEDFMDEEDLQDIKDSRTLIDGSEEMDFAGGSQQLRGTANIEDEIKDPITATLETTLLPAPKDSVGAKILKKMGWRLGQGIGPRISLKRRKEQDAQAYDPLTGNKLISGHLNIQEGDEEAEKHTYAPRDTPILVLNRKDNTHGLGYVPGLTLQESLENGKSDSASDPRLAGGFGLGALNDADEDDLDVYDAMQQTRRPRRTAYEHLDDEDNDAIVIGTNVKKRQAMANAPIQHFRDGRPVLAGFSVSDEPVAQEKWFPLPEIPHGWKPDPRRVWVNDNEHPPSHSAEPLPHAKWRQSKISADQRGAMLGETPLPSGPRSVFDYMSEKDKERIHRISANLTSAHGSGSTSATSSASYPPPSSTARLEPHVAQAALRGFQPFTSDPAKQARYTIFLQSQADPGGSTVPLIPLAGQKHDDFAKELDDYGKAASLFKPMSVAMAGRFTSAAVLDMGPKIIEGLHQPSIAELEENERKRKEEDEELAKQNAHPKIHAASMGMFGPMTREITPWVPARLLCKRFGVKDPDVQMTDPLNPATDSTAGLDAQTSDIGSTATQQDTPSLIAADASFFTRKNNGPRDITNIGLGEDETQGQDTLTYQRPSMDVFKAIFASDDEDEVDEQEEDEKDEEITAIEERKDGSTGFTNATSILEDKPFDPDNFRPTFTRQPDKEKGEKSKERKEKKEKKKGKDKKGVLVSFAIEEEGEDEPKQLKDRPPKKKRKKAQRDATTDGDNLRMEVVRPLLLANSDEVGPSLVGSVTHMDAAGSIPSKGRKRAVDFMD